MSKLLSFSADPPAVSWSPLLSIRSLRRPSNCPTVSPSAVAGTVSAPSEIANLRIVQSIGVVGEVTG